MCSRAIELLQEAEDLATRNSDVRSAISMAHNRSLALQQQGKLLESQAVLERCLALAKKNRISGEVVRALHGLANLAWDQGKPAVAIHRYKKALATAHELKNVDHTALISLNLAKVFRSRGESAEALRVLASVDATDFEQADAHFFSMELAELFDDAGRKDDCLKQWRQAQVQGSTIGDRSVVFKASLEAAKCLEANSQFDDALVSLDQAFQAASDPEEKGMVYTVKIRILGTSEREKECQSAIDEALKFARTHDLPEHRLDYLMVIGDVQWNEAGKGRSEAAKTYTIALLEAFGSLPERLSDIAMHVVGKINSLKKSERSGTNQMLQDGITEWVKRMCGKDSAKMRSLALWPYRVADRLLDAADNKITITADQAAELYVEEMLAASMTKR